MNKVYLLLRNNNILGPFSIDELLQQHLRSTDLIWMEGKSVAWCFPSQIKELNNDFQRILSSVDQEESKGEISPQQVLHLPGLSFEERAEAIRKKALSYSEPLPVVKKQVIPEEKFSSPYYGNEKEPMNVTYHGSKKYVTLTQLIASGALTALVAWAWYSGWSPVNPKIASEQTAVVPVNMVSAQENTAKQTTPADTINGTIILDSTMAKPVLAAWVKKPSKSIDTSTSSDNSVAVTSNQTSVQVPEAAIPIEEPVKKEASNEVINSEVKKENPEEPQTAIEETEKKKKFGQVIKGIFKKKKKDKEETSDSE